MRPLAAWTPRPVALAGRFARNQGHFYRDRGHENAVRTSVAKKQPTSHKDAYGK
jgi:hypothetical protein